MKAFGLPVDIFVYGTSTTPNVTESLAKSPMSALMRDVRLQSREQSEAVLQKLPTHFEGHIDIRALHMGARSLAERYEMKKCLELVEDAEKARKRPYRFLVRTRTDLKWLANHPPATLLGEDHCWIPEGQDYGGINDRHAFCGRQAGDVYFRLWDAAVAGYLNGRSSEAALHEYLQGRKVPIGRFGNVAALLCCPSGELCHSRVLEKRDRCLESEFKYEEEETSAKENAKRLNGVGEQVFSWSRNAHQPDRVVILKRTSPIV